MASERDQSNEAWRATRRATRAADQMLARAAQEIIQTFNRATVNIGPVSVNHRPIIMRAIDPIIRRYYGGHGVDPLQSELYRLIRRQSQLTFLSNYRSGWRDLDRIMVDSPRDWQIIRQFLRSAPLDDADGLMTTYRVLFGPHVERQRLLNAKVFDPQRQWVDPRGYRLSTRLWRNGERYRAGIERTLLEGIRRGESHQDLAKRLERYLNPEYAPLEYMADGRIVRKNMTAKPSGPHFGHGSTYARQLARTEINRVHGESTKDRARDVPGANGIKWRLSAQHPEYDICDEHATLDLFELGPGVYPIDQVPRFPAHPNCICSLVTQHRDRDEVRQEIIAKYRARAQANYEARMANQEAVYV